MKQIAKLKDDARRYELQEEWEHAIDAYLQVLRLSDDDLSEMDLPLYNRVGDLYVRLGKPMDAVKYYEQAADRYAEAGLYNNAIALCNKALRYEPGRLPLLKKLGAFSASQGFFTDARRWYLEFAEKSLKRGAVDEAFSALSELAAISDDPEIRELLARQLREYGREAEAIQEFKRLHAALLSAGQQQEADAIAAELKQLDPGIELALEPPAHEPAHEARDWYYLEELPGFADVEAPTPASMAQPAAAEPDRQPESELQPEEPSTPDEELAAQTSQEEPLEAQSEESAFVQTETTEYFDLPELSFDEFDDDDVAPEPIADIMHDEPLDFGPLEVEVEEHHELIDISRLRIPPQDDGEPAEPVSAYAEFEDFNVEFDEPELELPMLDLGDVIEEQDGAEPSQPADQLAAGLPLSPITEAEAGTIASFDEAEFGDYMPEPEPRVFDFEDDLEDQDDHEEQEARAAYETREEPQVEEVVEEFVAELEFESAAEPEMEPKLEPTEPVAEFQSFGEFESAPGFQRADAEEISAHADEQVFDQEEPAAEPAYEVPAFEQEEPAVEPAYEAPAFEQEEPLVEPAYQAPTFEQEEPTAQPAYEVPTFEHDEDQAPEPEDEAPTPERDELVADPVYEAPVIELPAVHLPPPPLPPPPSRRPAFEYVDLAALLDEKAEEVAEESTRFVVAEMPPTGDEERDFADMLQQFKQKVAQSIPKDDAGSHYDLGIAFKEMGLIDEAIGEFQTALRSGQDKLKVYEELGTCFMMKQQFSIAITVLNRAQQMPHADDSELLGVFYNLGRAHEELGQKAEAKAAFEKIVAIDIGFQDTTQRLTKL